MAEITIPSVGIAMEEALVVKWLKQPGEAVAVDDPVAEIETDKATMDIVSPVAGTLGPHLVEPGAIVPVGGTIVHVYAPGAPAGASEDVTSEDTLPDDALGEHEVSEHTTSEHAASEERTPVAPAVRAAPLAVTGEAERAAHGLSPRARRLAKERERQPDASAPAADGRFRALIAAKVAESWREIPHFTVSRAVDAQPMQAVLAALRAEGLSPSPTLTDLLLRALGLALAASGQKGPLDIGLAVATPAGVVIPVVRDVLEQAPGELARARADAIGRARDGKLSQEDLTARPASTLSNLGSFGVDRFTGIVAVGQTSLLTVGRARPHVVADDRGAISVRTMFDATLNADHRTVDGAEAAHLLVAFATAAEGMTPDAWERRE